MNNKVNWITKDTSHKDIAQILDIKGLDVEINKELTHITEKWLAHYVDKWDDFCFETMYEAYKKLGAGKVLVISKNDFKEFLEWGIPKWNKHQEQEDDHWLQAFEYQMETLKVPFTKDVGVKDYIPTKYEKVIHECIDLLKQEGSDTKQQVLEKLEELVK